jgi:hypothetical protein
VTYSYGYRVEQAGSCNVSRDLASQWRNGPHWHTLWPDNGGSWCFETEAEATERRDELVGWARDADREPLPSDGPEYHADHALGITRRKTT